MTIEHIAKNGQRWKFPIDCTPYQAKLLRRMLYAMRSVGSREGLTLTYLENAQDNDVFLADAENTILQALEDWGRGSATATDVLGFGLSNYSGGGIERRTAANTDTTAGASTVVDLPAVQEPVEERGPFYWERDNF